MQLSFWIFLIVYGVLMLVISPKTTTFDGFYKGKDHKGRDSSLMMISGSLFISWIMAKSVTNTANLGAKYGIVGGIAYGAYWFAIPLAGVVIYRLRTKFGAKGIVSFLHENYGRSAAIAFTAAIFIRLFNEVWSNTSVVGGYYGIAGSGAFIAAAVLFTLITLIYSLKGGLRSSIFTDFIQTLIFVFFIAFVLAIIIPKKPLGTYMTSSSWTMAGGVDMLLVSLVQIVSYPFHDPVLTDRGFISDRKTMLKAFTIAGLTGFVAIVLFSFVGIYGAMEGVAQTGNIPVEVARLGGTATLFLMTIIMVSAAGSTLDSTFASLSKLSAVDLPAVIGKAFQLDKARKIGMVMMVIFAVVGNLPMIFGTDVLKATTISGTMVMGFAPIFCLHGFVKPTKAGFHISFWLGIIIGILYTMELIPSYFGIGGGDSALLLGVNVYGLLLCTAGYVIPGVLAQVTEGKNKLQNLGDAEA